MIERAAFASLELERDHLGYALPLASCPQPQRAIHIDAEPIYWSAIHHPRSG
jgi:hypothetical protein